MKTFHSDGQVMIQIISQMNGAVVSYTYGLYMWDKSDVMFMGSNPFNRYWYCILQDCVSECLRPVSGRVIEKVDAVLVPGSSEDSG
jgi:hypothetical protein